MWLMAIPAAPFAYPLRLLQRWKNRHHPYQMDGILAMDELIEFIRIHEKGEGLGGRLEDGTGCMLRMIMVQQEGVKHWKSVIVLSSDSQASSTMFQRHVNEEYETSDTMSPMTESSRGSIQDITRGLRRRTNRSSEAFPKALSETVVTALAPPPMRRDSTIVGVVDQSYYQREDLSLDNLPPNRTSTMTSRRKLPLRLAQIDGPSVSQINRLSSCNAVDPQFRRKGKLTSGQWFKALLSDFDTLTSDRPIIPPSTQSVCLSNWKNLRNSLRSASTGTILEYRSPNGRLETSFWTSGHMPQARQSVYSYFGVEDAGRRRSKKTD